MFSMRQAATEAGMNYETLKFYCKEGLVPNVKRDENNYRVFNEDNIIWLRSLQCLKQSGMSIKELKHFMELCIQGEETLLTRKEILNVQKKVLLKKREELDNNIAYIELKSSFYDDLLAGNIEYVNKLAPNT